MRCSVCGYELSQTARFCKNCGTAVAKMEIKETHNDYQYNGYEKNDNAVWKNTGEGKNTGLIIALIVVSSFLAITIIAGILIFVFKGKGNVPERDVVIRQESLADVEEEIVQYEEYTEPAVVFDRTVTYSAAYKYKNMPGIYSSVEASDSEAVEMKSFITNYNRCWEEFVNFDNSEIYNYLRKGTVAYRYTNNFDKTGLNEKFDLIDVEDVRKSGDTYYVWVHEKIRKIRNYDETVKTYHWVYKVGKDDGGRYVELYTADPYYN